MLSFKTKPQCASYRIRRVHSRGIKHRTNRSSPHIVTSTKQASSIKSGASSVVLQAPPLSYVVALRTADARGKIVVHIGQGHHHRLLVTPDFSRDQEVEEAVVIPLVLVAVVVVVVRVNAHGAGNVV